MTGRRHALIIANASYDDEALKKLRSPASDADALARVLADSQIGDFEVEVVQDEPSHVIRRRIEGFFSDRRRDDTLVLHFSCHGLKSESGELYLAAGDTEPRLLDATAVPAHFVRRCMSRTRAGSTVLFLDCCYGGAFSRGSSTVRAGGDVNVLDSFTGEKPVGGRGWAVITASTSMEYAMEGGELKKGTAVPPSVFTHAVVEGLETGEADLDDDGEVSLDDLYEYVFEHVREQNPNQTPSKTVEMQGGMHLAHSRSRRIRITPLPIPAELRAALKSRNVFTRRGAVVALRDRLRDPRLAVAEGARLALLEVAEGDVQEVAEKASEALEEVRLRPSTDRLDFGRVARGSPAPDRSVALNGIPLARRCLARATVPWLRVADSAEGLAVRVDTSAEGLLNGDIVLKGVADDAVVAVELEVEVEPTVEEEPGEQTPSGAPGQPPIPVDTVPDGPSAGRRTEALTRPENETTPEAEPEPGTGTEPEPDPVGIHPPGPTEAPPTVVTPGPLHEPPPAVTPQPPPQPPPRRPPPPPPRIEARPGPRRAPVLAAFSLALAAASVIACIPTAMAVSDAVERRSQAGKYGHLKDYVDAGLFAPLTVALVSAVAALVLIGLARHEARARHDRYTDKARNTTHTLTGTAKPFAIAVLVLAILTWITYFVAGANW